jgi:hypothetical protein
MTQSKPLPLNGAGVRFFSSCSRRFRRALLCFCSRRCRRRPSCISWCSTCFVAGVQQVVGLLFSRPARRSWYLCPVLLQCARTRPRTPKARICPEARHKARAHAHCLARKSAALAFPIPRPPPACLLPMRMEGKPHHAPRICPYARLMHRASHDLCTALARCSHISSSTLALLLISLTTLSLTTPNTTLLHNSVTPALYKVRW